MIMRASSIFLCFFLPIAVFVHEGDYQVQALPPPQGSIRQHHHHHHRQKQREEDNVNNPLEEKNNKQRIQSHQVPSASGHFQAASSSTWRIKKKKNMSVAVFVFFLATLTGITDVICSNLYDSYPNMMTGNTIRFAAAASKLDWDDTVYFGSLILGYGAGASLFRWLEQRSTTSVAAAAAATKTTTTTTTAARTSSTDDTTASTTSSEELTTEKLSYQQSMKSLQSTERTLLLNVAVMSLMSFGVADALAPLFPQKRFILPLLSIGFGMVHAATLNALDGTVTNAVTGHYTKIGLGVVEHVVLSLLGEGGRNNNNKNNNGDGGLAKCRTSIVFVVTFISSLALTNVAFRWVNRHPALVSHLPPLGITFGVLYASLLGWYSDFKAPWLEF